MQGQEIKTVNILGSRSCNIILKLGLIVMKFKNYLFVRMFNLLL